MDYTLSKILMGHFFKIYAFIILKQCHFDQTAGFKGEIFMESS